MPKPSDYTDDMGYGSRLPKGHAARYDNAGAVASPDTGPGFGPEVRKGYLTLDEAKGANGTLAKRGRPSKSADRMPKPASGGNAPPRRAARRSY